MIITVLFPGKEGLKGIQRGTKQRLVRVITKVITAIHLKKQRDLNFKERGSLIVGRVSE